MNYSQEFLGQKVMIKIDRPIGSKHPRHDFVYELNYGYVPSTNAPDGEEVDAYILGESASLKQFEGKCIAIIKRLDDDDDKLIVCDEAQDFSDQQIKDLTHFQEQWFSSKIIRE